MKSVFQVFLVFSQLYQRGGNYACLILPVGSQKKNTKLKKSQLFRRTVRKMHTCQKPVEVQKSMPGNKVLHATRRTAKRCQFFRFPSDFVTDLLQLEVFMRGILQFVIFNQKYLSNLLLFSNSYSRSDFLIGKLGSP